MAIQDFSGYDPEVPMYCANHPTVQTYLRCSNCNKPICAKCRVSTPVGFKCYQCANLQVLPTYAVSSDYYVKSAVAGLGAAAIAGIIMGVFPAFEFWAALLMGIAVPEAITAAANQKRGPGLTCRRHRVCSLRLLLEPCRNAPGLVANSKPRRHQPPPVRRYLLPGQHSFLREPVHPPVAGNGPLLRHPATQITRRAT